MVEIHGRLHARFTLLSCTHQISLSHLEDLSSSTLTSNLLSDNSASCSVEKQMHDLKGSAGGSKMVALLIFF